MWIDENHIHFLDFIFSCCHIRNYSTPLGCVKSAKYWWFWLYLCYKI